MSEESRWVGSRKDFPEERVSYSVLKELEKCPAAAIYKKYNKTPPTPTMEFGSAVEDILFGSTPPRVVAHSTEKSKLTKEFKAAKAEALKTDDQVLYLDQETFDTAHDCADQVSATSLWNTYMVGGEMQRSVAGVLVMESGDERQNVANIIDVVVHMNDDHGSLPVALIDLKVIADPSPHAFRNQVDRMRWDVQAASYVRMVEEITGRRVPFFWFVVQNSAPWNVAMYRIDEKWLDNAEATFERWVWEWHAWKNEEIVGQAMELNSQPVTLVTPPWRT